MEPKVATEICPTTTHGCEKAGVFLVDVRERDEVAQLARVGNSLDGGRSLKTTYYLMNWALKMQ